MEMGLFGCHSLMLHAAEGVDGSGVAGLQWLECVLRGSPVQGKYAVLLPQCSDCITGRSA